MRSDLREADTLVAWQWEATYRSGNYPPERRLLVAVLEDALVGLRKAMASSRPDDPELMELKRWFSRRDETGPFSFEYICEQLGFDPDGIRRRLDALAETPPARPPRRRAKSPA